MHPQPKHLDPDHHAPEVAREQADVEKGGRGEPEHEGREGVEEGEAEGVADEVTADGAGPGCSAEGGAVEDAGLGAVDEHAPETELADYLVQRPFTDQELLGHVTHAIERRAEQGEEVPL